MNKKQTRARKVSRNWNKIGRNWFQSERTRPRMFNLTVERASDGTYCIIDAIADRIINQYSAIPADVNLKALAEDLRRNADKIAALAM